MQEAWLRLSRSDAATVSNLAGWLTTVVSRVCLDMLRARRARQEEYVGSWLPEPIVSLDDHVDPEQEAILADSLGSRCSWCWRRSRPRSGSRLCCTTCSACRSTRSPASSTGRRMPPASSRAGAGAGCDGAAPSPDADQSRQREIVDAFVAAARSGDFEALLAVLDPDVVFRIDSGPQPAPPGRRSRGRRPSRGRSSRARPALRPSRAPALVNGTAGFVVGPGDRPFAVVAFTLVRDRIVAIDIITDPDKLHL